MKKSAWLFVLVPALLLVLSAPLVGYPVFLMKLLCFALFACAFNLLVGYTGLLSFGHAAFLGAGGYLAGYALATLGWPVPAGLALGVLGTALLGLVMGALADPPHRHLLFDDHAGAGADGVLRGAARAGDAWRGRHAGRAARDAARPGPR